MVESKGINGYFVEHLEHNNFSHFAHAFDFEEKQDPVFPTLHSSHIPTVVVVVRRCCCYCHDEGSTGSYRNEDYDRKMTIDIMKKYSTSRL